MVKYRVIVIKLLSCDMDKITPDCCGFLYINHLDLILIYSLIISDVCLLCKTRPLKEGEAATVTRGAKATGASAEDSPATKDCKIITMEY